MNVPTTITQLGVEIVDVSYRFGRAEALTSVTASIRPGTITGLVGRNGAGKTTLASLIAGLRPLSTGEITVGGESVWENPDRTARICLMRDKGVIMEDEKLIETLRIQRSLRPHWDEDYFYSLLDGFEVPRRKVPSRLSTGQRSAVRASLALATRAEVTILDEVYLGMDAVLRRRFYDELMKDYLAHPRTIVLSSHLLDEVEDLLEDVLMLDHGRVVAAGNTESVREQHSSGDHLASLTDVLVSLSSQGGSR